MADVHHTTIHDLQLDADIPVVVEYVIDGLFEIDIRSVRPELFGLGAEILHTLDEITVEGLEQEICRLIPWRKSRDTDYPNYAPPRELA